MTANNGVVRYLAPCGRSEAQAGRSPETTMNELELALPVELFVPVYWTRTKKAFVRSADGISIATVQRSVTYTRRVMGIPLSHVEALDYQGAIDPTARCKVLIRPRFPLEFHGADANSLGRLTAKAVSVWPECVCFDQDGRVIGSIQPGLHKVEFRFNSSMCCGLFSRAKSKGLRPRQYVWEFNATNASSMDIRLLLGFVAMREMPGPSD